MVPEPERGRRAGTDRNLTDDGFAAGRQSGGIKFTPPERSCLLIPATFRGSSRARSRRGPPLCTATYSVPMSFSEAQCHRNCHRTIRDAAGKGVTAVVGRLPKLKQKRKLR